MGTEIELKLLVATKDLPRLRDVLGALAAPVEPRRQRLLSHYFDTPTLQFRDKGVALRVRRVDGQWLQTLKGGGGVAAGMHRRGEWETVVNRPMPDFARLAAAFPADKVLARFLKKMSAEKLSGGHAIQRLFSTEFRRDAFDLTLPDGTQVEAAVDEGEVRIDKIRTPIAELELELKSGDPLAIVELARRLLLALPLRIGVVTKAQRGYSLLVAGKVSAPRRAADIALRLTMPVDDAFARILAECFDHLLHNVDGVVAGHDPEYLHQMRVAMRRLRGALAVFGDVVPQVVFAGLAHGFQQLGQALGEARNWDVLRHETLPACATAMKISLSPALHTQLEEQAHRVATRAKRLVVSRAFTDMALRTALFIIGHRWRGAAGESAAVALAEPVGAFAQRAITKRHKQLKKRAAAALPGQPESLHAVRIAAKKLRYALEFFASLFPEKAVRGHLQCLADLQDILGTINDAATATQLLALMVEPLPHLLPEVAQWEAALTARSQHSQKQFVKVWARFARRPVLP